MTLDQQKALALATARLRLQQQLNSDPQPQGGALSADNATRAVATGVPIIGGLLNKLDAATNATLAPAVDPVLPDSFQKLPEQNWNDRYQHALDIQQGKDEAFHQEHPYVDTGLQVAGGVAATAPVMAAAPGLFGLGQGSRVAKIAAAGASGMGIGATDSGIRSDLDPRQTATGAVVGLGAGAAGPYLGQMIGSGVRYFTSAGEDALSGLSKAAQRYISDTLGSPDKVAQLRDALSRLGDNAMLADASPEWLGVARGSAAQPGMRDAIVTPLAERAAGANSRLATAMDENLGPNVVPSEVQRGIEANQHAVGPSYREAFRDGRPYDMQPIADAIDADIGRLRGPAQNSLRQVRGMLNVNGTQQLSSDPNVMFETRQAIDGMLQTEQNVKAISALVDARQMLDDGLTRAVPSIKEPDAVYAELARQKAALGRGQQVLDSGRTSPRPSELAQEVEQGVQPQGLQIGPSAVPLRLSQGARAEVDRIVGTNANDVARMNQLIKGDGDWNRSRLATLFGQEKADRLFRVLEGEKIFADTNNRVTRGSDTAMANRFGAMLDDVSKTSEIPADTTLTGLGLRAAHKTIKSALEERAEQAGARFANDLGRVSVAQGAQRDAIVQALVRRSQLPPTDPRIQALVNAVTTASARQASR
ncbi:hypothetical protein DTW90_12115 [Neorhizobium sp. P12A]|uniref:hypothetical protein n=1 Tax=Neorhizobium sp. P12A TaxID=2268027 RepID=UPI0011EEB308|nr:hypothetical protein [Neorhizobium sp. P12A]KAA0698545.1 hypothetical protein DTW90_12115 [Neorhizobium sp. P12A]